MNRYATLLTLYVLIQNGAVVSKATYNGMDQRTVDSLLRDQLAASRGATYQFVTKKDFDAVPDPVITPPTDPVRDQAVVDAKNPLLAPQQRIDALTKALGL